MSHKVYVGKQGSIIQAQFNPQGLENPVTYVPEVPEWDGKTRASEVPFGLCAFVWTDKSQGWEMLRVPRLAGDRPAIPIIEPKPLEGE